jgi:hypothetical protein
MVNDGNGNGRKVSKMKDLKGDINKSGQTSQNHIF